MRELIRLSLLGSVLLALLMITVDSCGTKEDDENPQDTTVISYISTFVSPKSEAQFNIGQKVPFKITYSDGGKSLVKTEITWDDKIIYSSELKQKEIAFDFATDTVQLGPHIIKLGVELNDGTVEKYEQGIMILSNVTPKEYSYKVINKFEHDVNAYTQGLVFENGYMYEGTGLEGKSELRYVDFKRSKVLRTHKLENNIFGEGVAVLKDKVYQLTYTTNRGYVYDKSTFKLLRDFTYPTQGWGLTHNGSSLILSDGSPTIYFYDPETFAFQRKIVVVDDKSPIGLINELEYINDEIWANVYQTDLILRINPKTGSVNSTINMSGLLTQQEKMQHVDVLNGIAYDAVGKRLYVTGKLWPWLFEIELVDQGPK
jgi:glutamine cyclotransferase